MRRHVIPLLILAFALFTGACAGRQVRGTYVPRPADAMRQSETASPDAADAVPVKADVTPAEPVPAVEATAAVISETPAAAPARKAPRHKKPRRMPVAVLKTEPVRQPAAELVAHAPTPKVPGTVAVPGTSEPIPAASVPTVHGPQTDRIETSAAGFVSNRIPDPGAVPTGEDILEAYALGIAISFCLGLLGGLLLSRWTSRPSWLRFDDRTSGIHPPILDPPVTQDQPVATRLTAASEQEWYSETDSPAEGEPAKARPTPRFASGSGQISSQGLQAATVSGETVVADPPIAHTQEPETYPTIIYDSDPSAPP